MVAPAAAGGLLGGIAAAGNIAEVAGTVGTVLEISDALSAESAFTYNLCTFVWHDSGVQSREIALPLKKAFKEKRETWAAFSDPFLIVRDDEWEPEAKGAANAELRLTAIVGPRSVIGMVVLYELNGFNFKKGDNFAVEIVPHRLADCQVLLLMHGFVNPLAKGYAYFEAGVLAQLDLDVVSKQAAVARRSSGTYYCQGIAKYRGVFVNQAPPPTSAFLGKKIECNIRDTGGLYIALT